MEPSPDRFKIGIVGCGRISQTYVAAIQQCPIVDLAAVMDTRSEPALATAQEANCRAYTDLDRFLRESGIEGAVICSPPNTHRPVACALMERDIHVLCEKPFATRRQDAVDMDMMARKSGVTLMMASKFRYVDDIIRAKAMVASGMMGEVQFYENRFSARVNMRGRWNADAEAGGGGVLIDNGTHSVDIVRYLVGRIRKVHARPGKRIMGLSVEDTASLNFVTDDGAMGSVFVSWCVQADGGPYIAIFGDEGALRIGWQESACQLNGRPEWIPFGTGYNKQEAFKHQVINFVETARGVGRPLITPADALASVAVIEAAYRSMEADSWLAVDEDFQPPELVIERVSRARSA